MTHVELYIKGASFKKGSAWAYILVFGNHEKFDTGTTKQDSPNMAGLQAIIHGLRALKQDCDVLLTTSSTYLLGGIAVLKNGASYDTYRLYWLQLADLLTHHAVTVCYSPVEQSPLLQRAYDLALGEMERTFGIERELLGAKS